MIRKRRNYLRLYRRYLAGKERRLGLYGRLREFAWNELLSTKFTIWETNVREAFPGYCAKCDREVEREREVEISALMKLGLTREEAIAERKARRKAGIKTDYYNDHAVAFGLISMTGGLA